MPFARPIAAVLLLVASLAAAPASQPAPRDAVPGRPGERLERLLALDDLTAEQRTKIEAIAADVRAAFERSRAATAPADRADLRQAIERARNEALAVLTPAQRDRLRVGRDVATPATAPATRAVTRPVAVVAKPPTSAPGATTKPIAITSPTTRPSADVGERLPNFSLAQLVGKPITFEQLIGKPVVLVFGSYSAPEFRDQLPRVADLAARYGGRVRFVVVYTREMFPNVDGVDQPERNQDAKIAIAAAKTDADRAAAAKRLVDSLKVKLPIGLDAIDDRFAIAVGGFPNAAIVADAKGIVVARWTWAEPFAIKRELDKLLASK